MQSPLRQQLKEAKKYTFNQYSNKPQIYIEGPPGQEIESEEAFQQASSLSLQFSEQILQAQQPQPQPLQTQPLQNFIEEQYGLGQIAPPSLQPTIQVAPPVQHHPPPFVQPQMPCVSSTPYSVNLPSGSYIQLTHSQGSVPRPAEQLPLFTNVPPPSLQQPPPALGQPTILTSQAHQPLYASQNTQVPPFSGQTFTTPPPPPQPTYQPPPVGVSYWGGPS